MPINTAPAPATHTSVPDAGGRGTVLRITTSHNLDGQSLALQLYDTFAHHVEDGTPLPDEITADTVMELLGSRTALCAEGWHESANEPTQEAWNQVWPWAEAHIRRLFPDLTWNVEEGHRTLLGPQGSTA
ncbi:hypothetical protein ACFC0S_16165 [Streptomyces sp. NPDC056084]|uniref:hypothetical protein n=1 Tax=unclassified Streptomyces TaxID=2593676 RepID=UPI0035DF9D9D